MRPDQAVAAPMNHRRFLRHPDQVAAARRFVTEAVAEPELRETARLLVSETITSMLDQRPAGPGDGMVEVACTTAGDGLRVEVSDDGGPARLRQRIQGAQSQSGRGLQLVQALAGRWGVREDSGGRTIWFELVAPRPG